MLAHRKILILVAALISPATLSAQRLDEAAVQRIPTVVPLHSAITEPSVRPAAGGAAGWRAEHPKLISLAATVVPTVAGVLMIAAMDEPYTTTGRTVLNSAVLWSGPVLGPAAGYAAGSDTRRGVFGALLRTGILAGAWLLAPSQDTNDGFLPNPEISFHGESSPDIGIWLGATGAILVSAIIDIAVAR